MDVFLMKKVAVFFFLAISLRHLLTLFFFYSSLQSHTHTPRALTESMLLLVRMSIYLHVLWEKIIQVKF